MDKNFTRPRGDGLPSTSHILNAIRSDLARVILPDVQSERSRVLLQMTDLMLRHLITREEFGGGEVARAVPARVAENLRAQIEREYEALGAITSAEEKIELLELAPDISALFVVSPDRLTDYLRSQVPGMTEAVVTNVAQVVGGLSKETFLFDVQLPDGPAGFVMRRDIPNPPIQSSAPDEAKVLHPLFKLGLPVPEPVHSEYDPAFFGMPFQISRKVGGRAISGAVEINNLGAEAKGNCELLARFLGQLHSVNISLLPEMSHAGWSTTDYVREHVSQWQAWWRSNQMEPSVIVDTAYEWLLANVPQSPRPVLVHGDAGLHNIMVEGGRTTAMIDWELVHVGDPSEDLLYCRNWVDQVMNFDAFLRIYRDHGGAEINADNSHYYSLLNCVRNVTCSIAQYRGYRDAVLPLLPSAYSGIKWQKVFLRKAAEELKTLLPN
ncbi:hypothetical protein DM806_22210 [Sphingobium lactosutens]|uniref:phosphotransferase family protein n=1 Tax=Sphingobium lactosutens TaxID=522773 RepID=UPI0015BE8826|nr:phosphotransferase family protein [Sphingobium lactosutens]NWK98331.1 hypothetical protein [Sphingobium lactosutens]